MNFEQPPINTYEEVNDGELENPKDTYGDVETMFLVEDLKSNFDDVEKQMWEIYGLISDYNQLKEKQKEDLDMDIYIDEAIEKIDNALQFFKINNKTIDIRTIAREGSYEDIYNNIVFNINNYIEYNMIRSGKQRLPEL